MSEYKHTLNLPKTEFAMKANLANREPAQLRKWYEQDLYNKMLAKREGRQPFILHDGPPYANGDIHIGHALNKILKDIVVKSKAMSGFYTPYIPGWDCHGLPIEVRIEKKHGKAGNKLSESEFREKCRTYAASQVDVQRESFKRLGILGDWDNPYLTMDFEYEANIVRSLGKIHAKGYLKKGFKPVHWCYECCSALAEAEVEYKDKQSPSIDVGFEIVNKEKIQELFGKTIDKAVFMPIWTTTPWTLPSNEAVCVHPELNYVLIQTDKWGIILAEALVESALARFGLDEGEYQTVGSIVGKELEYRDDQGLLLQHPFNDRTVPVILGEHVTTDAGTGCVHTAPSHGVDDFNVGKKYDLPIETRVNGRGVFVDGVEHVAGEFVFKANKSLIELLESRGNLLANEALEHSYPHCWRHKTPVIFRATPQWFVDMSAEKGLRERSMKAISDVQWIPGKGQARIEGMVADRPDWCISRQRTWSVPMPLFVNPDTNELHPKTSEHLETVAKLIEARGIEAWFELDAKEILGEEAGQYTKVADTLDVWFDSGVTHECVLRARKELSAPADLYLEGSDQHRGWFNSSLMTSIAMNDEAPYKAVLTHGFTVDGNGRKMSKSVGNVIAPQEVFNKLGADVLRLWVSSVDYQADHSISDEILKRVSDTYRRVRNTVRYLLSNLFDFDPAQHLLDVDDLLYLDKLAVQCTAAAQEEILDAYDKYEFSKVYRKLHDFCSQDMGSFYLDIIKDRQYTCQTGSKARRSCQSAMYHILNALLRWMAPVLSFTADEAWTFVPGENEESVFFQDWYQIPLVNIDNGLPTWKNLKNLRMLVNNKLEEKRSEGLIKSALDAEVDIICKDPTLPEFENIEKLNEELRFVLITSNATFHREEAEPGCKELYPIKVMKSEHEKCVRCWHKREDVGKHEAHPELCGRCVDNIDGSGEVRHFA